MTRKREMEFEAEVGARLRDARLRRGMSQQDLATAVGTTQSGVSLYETGMRSVSSWMALRLSEALDVPAEELLFGMRAGWPAGGDTAELLQALESCSPEVRRAVLGFARFLMGPGQAWTTAAAYVPAEEDRVLP